MSQKVMDALTLERAFAAGDAAGYDGAEAEQNPYESTAEADAWEQGRECGACRAELDLLRMDGGGPLGFMGLLACVMLFMVLFGVPLAYLFNWIFEWAMS